MFKSILMPVDGSSLSYAPLGTAIELARQMKGRLVFLAIVEPRLFNSSEAEAEPGVAVEAFNLRTAEENVRKAVDCAQDASIPSEGVVALARVPGDEIVDAAKRLHCDVIVMATRGKTGMLDTLFGESTTQQVLRKSPVPVLVFP